MTGSSRPLAIGIVCYPSLGGSGVVAAELAAGLAERGHRVHVIASAPPRRALPFGERLTFQQVDVPHYPLFEHAPYEVALAAAVVAAAGAQRLDVVHAHYAVPHAASAYLARQALGEAAPPVVATLHGTDVTGVGVHPSYRSITRLTMAAADALTVPSLFLRDAARRLLDGDPAPPIEVIPNFVDTERFAPAARRDDAAFDAFFAARQRGPVLFHVSNFRPVKRIGDLLELLARLRRQVAARLVLVGDGPERAEAAERAAALGLGDCVAFLGQRTDFAPLLAQADAFAMPSEMESFGVAALEAMSCGVPVLGYRVGGLPEVVTDEVGTLVGAGDVEALAAAALALFADPARRAAQAQAGRQRAVAHFERRTAVERYESCYRRLVRDGRE